jgi:L-alanine-DL-glutamate epimerase-like enolase superfamily enzyme
MKIDCIRTHRLREELFEAAVEIDRDTVHVPTGSGLGVVVNRSAVQSFRVKETEIRR